MGARGYVRRRWQHDYKHLSCDYKLLSLFEEWYVLFKI